MEELEDKYIELLINRCINFNGSKSLLINIETKEHLYFAEKVKVKCAQMGIFDVYINIEDYYEIHDYLKNTPVEDIKAVPCIDRSKWDEYAIKGGALLLMITSLPGLMNDIEPEKIEAWMKARQKTTPYYSKNVRNYIFPWCIAALPSTKWVNFVFGDDEKGYEKLYLNILKMCMVDQEDPIKAWNDYISLSNENKQKLNDLEIRNLHYKNSIGTDLKIGLNPKWKWLNQDKNTKCGQLISNLPSYEIFTSPILSETNGIVYSTRPLIYNNTIINDFYLKFKDGKVVELYAEEGQKALEKIISIDKQASYLGECALVPYNSPISNTGLVFGETLFDENASCHLALGEGINYVTGLSSLSEEEYIAIGLNQSTIHADFMIGSKDLNIEAETNEGKRLIFKNGEFNL